MTFDDLQRSWKAEVDRPLPAIDRDALFRELQLRCSRSEHLTRRRDWREYIAVGAVVVGFVVLWPRIRTSWVSTIGLVWVAVWVVLVVITLAKSGRVKPLSSEASTNDFVRQKIEWCDRQIRLLNNVVWWYVLPAFVGILLIAGGKMLPQRPTAFGSYAVVVLVLCGGIVWLNRRAARLHYQPLRDDLSRLSEEL